MKGGNEHKHNMLNHLVKIPSTPRQEKLRKRSKSPPVHKFQYKLPQSFFEAVNDARVEAGYDILPRFHNLSISKPSNHHQKSPSLHRPNKRHRHNQHRHSHSLSTTPDKEDISRKKIRLNRKHSHHHHHHHKNRNPI